jgi:hypothetical protein
MVLLLLLLACWFWFQRQYLGPSCAELNHLFPVFDPFVLIRRRSLSILAYLVCMPGLVIIPARGLWHYCYGCVSFLPVQAFWRHVLILS